MQDGHTHSARLWLRCALATLSTCLVALALAGAAHAIPPNCEDPEDCPPEVVSHTAALTVTPPSSGSVTGPGISCGTDCSESYAWTETCYDFGQQRSCDETDVEDVSLVASGGPGGFTPAWSGCTSASGSTCTVRMNDDHAVSVTWVDNVAPTASLAGPAAKAGPSTVFTASASDNAGVAAVEFYVDGFLRHTDTSPPFQFAPNLGLYVDGSAHTLKVVSRDTSGNASSSLAAAPSHNFTIDRSTSLSNVSTPPSHGTSVPTVTFTHQLDATVTCRTKLNGDVKGTTVSCSSPYAAQVGGSPTDGQYTIELVATDDVGNTATATRPFTLDRGAPNLSISSPADGAVVGAPFTPGTTVSDGFTPDGQIAVTCKIDGGDFDACDGLAPPDGSHTLTVRAADLAGNTTSRSVDLTYDATPPVVTITGGPEEGAVVYARAASFAFSTSDLTGLTTSCKLDDAAFGPCTGPGGHDVAGLSLGIHALVIRAQDAAGHITDVERRFVVSDLPPAGGGGGGDGGAGGGGAGGPAVPQVIDASVTNFWALFGSKTRVKRLTVRGAPAGGTVTVTCKGKGCAFKRAVRQVAGAEVALAKLFKRRKLRPRTVIKIVIAKDGMVSQSYRYTLRRGKFPKLAKS